MARESDRLHTPAYTALDIAAALRAYAETMAPWWQRRAWRAAADYVQARFTPPG